MPMESRGGRNSMESSADGSSSKRSRIQQQEEQETPHFPEEIVIKILRRLPVKTLIRFRCVSKSWHSIISSPSFIKSHLQLATTRDPTLSPHHRIMLPILDHVFHLRHASLPSLIYQPSVEAFRIDYPKLGPGRPVRVVGSCHGLICLCVKEKDLYLWNPSIRSSARVPPPPLPPVVTQDLGYFTSFAFGYSERSNDYKILGNFSNVLNREIQDTAVMLYSSKANSWKVVENFKGLVHERDPGKFVNGTFVNGKVHFITISRLFMGQELRRDIVYFDLDSEANGILDQPNYKEGEGGALFKLNIGVLGGCICVSRVQETWVTFWVMKEYGVKESWAKIATFPQDRVRFLYLKPVVMLSSGEILLTMYGRDIVIYNPNDGGLRLLQHVAVGKVFFEMGADVYVESLVSPAATVASVHQS